MPDTVLIFANPIAGGGRGLPIARQIESVLTTGGYRVQTSFDHPKNTSDAMIDRSAKAVISVGGDGTLRSVVERFLKDPGELPPVLPIPLGTANLMSKHLGMKWPTNEIGTRALATVRENKVVRLDAGRANGKLFLLMAGIGIDGHIVHLLDGLREGPIDLTSYVLPAAISLASFSFPAIKVIVDDTIVFPTAPGVAFVGNIREYGTGFPILTRARSDDGLLDICIIPCKDRRALAEMLLLVPTGEHPLHEHVIYLRGKSVRVEGSKEVPVQIDGDAAGHTPLQIDVLPARVPFLMPAIT